MTTEAGQVRGAAPNARGIVAWKGIPCAAPPVGTLRWRPPQPAAPWAGVRETASFGPTCWAAQQPGPPRQASPQNEDCLTVNAWTPAPVGSAARPVMVWLHGGGFALGSSAVPACDGSNLAAHGVMAVPLNYRLGAFGFLAHPALEAGTGRSGAHGLQDQVAALRRVQRNSAALSGDPGNVALFGESAGAHAAGLLMAPRGPRACSPRPPSRAAHFETARTAPIVTHEAAPGALHRPVPA